MATAAGAARAARRPQAPQKRAYRQLTPTSKTVNGQPLYSPELSFGNLVFVSGKGPGTGFKGDITAQTKNVLDQIEESLKLAGSSMDKVLKVNVYLTDMANFAGMNEAYIGRFPSPPPVRTTVAVVGDPRRHAGRDRLHRGDLIGGGIEEELLVNRRTFLNAVAAAPALGLLRPRRRARRSCRRPKSRASGSTGRRTSTRSSTRATWS